MFLIPAVDFFRFLSFSFLVSCIIFFAAESLHSQTQENCERKSNFAPSCCEYSSG